MRLPKLQKDKNFLIQTKYAVSNIDNIAGVLTCLSVEAKRNDLTSMAYVLMELADGLGASAEEIETLIRCTERQRENEQEQNKKD